MIVITRFVGFVIVMGCAAIGAKVVYDKVNAWRIAATRNNAITPQD